MMLDYKKLTIEKGQKGDIEEQKILKGLSNMTSVDNSKQIFIKG